MSQIRKNHRDELPQEASQDGPSYHAELASPVQDSNYPQRERPSQAGGYNEPSDDVDMICEEVRKILSQIEQQTQIEELYLSGVQETVRTKVADAAKEFVQCVKRCFDDKRKIVFEIASETNGVLQRIAEQNKMRDTIKETMEATWNTLT